MFAKFFKWLDCKQRHYEYIGPNYCGLLGIYKITTCPHCGEDYAN